MEMNPERHDRKKALWKARMHAMQTLAQRYPAEFRELKDQFLKRWGLDPVGGTTRRPSSVEDPMQDPPVSP